MNERQPKHTHETNKLANNRRITPFTHCDEIFLKSLHVLAENIENVIISNCL